MKKLLSVSFLLLALSTSSNAEEKGYKTYTDIGEIEEPALTIPEVLDFPDKFHKEIITLDGKVGEIKFKETGNGRKFTLFRFFDNDPERAINVYARGFVEGINSGSRIRIWGRYSKQKRYFLFKRKNIMKAKKIQFL